MTYGNYAPFWVENNPGGQFVWLGRQPMGWLQGRSPEEWWDHVVGPENVELAKTFTSAALLAEHSLGRLWRIFLLDPLSWTPEDVRIAVENAKYEALGRAQAEEEEARRTLLHVAAQLEEILGRLPEATSRLRFGP